MLVKPPYNEEPRENEDAPFHTAKEKMAYASGNKNALTYPRKLMLH
jgi:hypothetical protein